MNRIYDDNRKAQGFRSQGHLDAFFAYYDHTTACPECQTSGPGAIIDDGCQPTHLLCPTARALDATIATF